MSVDITSQSEAEKWCKKAREILKTRKILGDTEKSERLKAAMNQVLAGLKELKKNNSKSDEYTRLNAEFMELAKVGKVAFETKNSGLSLVLASQLEHLKVRIDYAKNGGNVATKEDSRLRLENEVKLQYESDLEKAKRNLMSLASKADGKHTFVRELESIITRAIDATNDSKGDIVRDKAFTSAIMILSEADKAYEKAIGTHSLYLEYKSTLAAAKLQSQQLKLINASYSTEVEEVIRQGVALANTFDYSGAIKKLSEVETAFENTVKKQNIPKKQLTYIEKLSVLNGQVSQLSTYNYGGVDYAASVKKELQKAAELIKEKPANFDAAVTVLERASDEYEKQLEQAKSDQQNRIAAAKHKPVYDDKVLRITAAIQELELMPGTKAAVDALKKLLIAGENVVKTTGDYEKAYDALQGLSGAYKQGLQAAAAFSQTVGNELYRENLVFAQEQLKLLNQLIGTSQSELISEKQALINASLLRMSNGALPEQETITIGVLGAELKKLTEKSAEVRDQCLKLKTEVENLCKECEDKFIFPSDILLLLRSAEIDFSIDDYSAAIGMYNQAKSKLSNANSTLGSNYDKWQTTKKDIEDDLNDLDSIQDIAFPKLRKFGGLLAEKNKVIQSLPQTKDYAAAILLADKVREAAVEIRAMVANFNQTREERRTAGQEIQSEFTKAQLLIDDLAKEKCNIAPFENLLRELNTNWTIELGNCETVEEINKAVSNLKAKLKDSVSDPVNVILKDPSARQTSQKEAADLESRKELAVKLRNAELKIEELSKDSDKLDQVATPGLPIPVLKSAQTKLESISDMSTLQPKEAIEAADQLVVDVEEVLKKHSALRQDLSNEAIKVTQEALSLLNSIKSKHKKYGTFFIDITARVNDLVAMASSTVCATVELALNGAKTAMQQDIAPLANAFAEADKSLELIKLNLENRDLVTTMPDRRKSLKFRLEQEVTVALYSKGPIAGKKLLDDFLAELRRVVEDATQAKLTREEIKRRSQECLDKLESVEDAPTLVANFKKMIKAAANPVESGETRSLQQLKSILMQIESLINAASPQVREEMEKSAREREVQGELRRKEFEAARSVLEKNQIREATLKSKELTKSQVNWEMFKEIGELKKQADDMFKKGLVEAAFDKLTATRTKAEQFINNPLSVQVTARNNLGKTATRWRLAVGMYVRSMNTLLESVSRQMSQENSVTPDKYDIAAVSSPLDKAARSFDAGRFDAYIKTINDELAADPLKLANIKAYRQAKEEALRFVRHYQAIVAQDPILQKVVGNPFGVDVAVREVGEALRDLELNLRRA